MVRSNLHSRGVAGGGAAGEGAAGGGAAVQRQEEGRREEGQRTAGGGAPGEGAMGWRREDAVAAEGRGKAGGDAAAEVRGMATEAKARSVPNLRRTKKAGQIRRQGRGGGEGAADGGSRQQAMAPTKLLGETRQITGWRDGGRDDLCDERRRRMDFGKRIEVRDESEGEKE